MSKENDQLRGLGFTVGVPSLLETVQESSGAEHTFNQPVRKGMGHNAADALNDQLSKGGAGFPVFKEPKTIRVSPHAEEKRSDYEEKDLKRKEKADEEFRKKKRTDHDGALKNTHGENWHKDNDKEVEELVSGSEEIDREFDGSDKDNKRPAKTNSREWQDNSRGGEKNYSYEFKSMSNEELFIKATAPKKQIKKGAFKEMDIEESLDSLINFAEDPFKGQEDVIANIHENSDGIVERRVEKGAQLEEDKDPAVGKKIGKLIDDGKDKNQAAAIAISMKKEGKLSRQGDYNKDGADDEAEKSELDLLTDLIKAAPQAPTLGAKEGRVPVMRNHAKPSNKQFIKAEGSGGMVFDFGHKTGNDMADRATELLNRHGDPVQLSNVGYQKQSYDQALVDYTQKGDTAFNQNQSPFGNIDKNWDKQLNTPLDEQVKQLYKAELESKDPSIPAVKNDFNKTQLNVGGDVVKATSETDAAVLEMYRSQIEAGSTEGEVIADASFGGAQKIEITL